MKPQHYQKMQMQRSWRTSFLSPSDQPATDERVEPYPAQELASGTPTQQPTSIHLYFSINQRMA